MTGANAVQSFVGQLIRDSRVAEFAWNGEDQSDAPVVPQSASQTEWLTGS